MSTFVKAPKSGIMLSGRCIVEDEAPVKPRRYLVFAGDHYYPTGGWEDFIGSADTKADAIESAMASGKQWTQVIDIETGQEVV